MKQELNLVMFPTRSPLGLELAQEVRKLAEEKYHFHVYILENFSVEQFLYSCANADAVVLDATLEDDPKEHNYEFLAPNLLERLLVVSRTYTPINFIGVIGGGTAKYSDPNTPLGQKTNQSILEWLDEQLEKTSSNPRNRNLLQLITPWWIRFLAEPWVSAIKSKSSREKNQIFISYRSKYHANVLDLAQHLKNEKNYEETFIFYFDPGELVYEDELLSPLRRWQLLSLIQDHIIESREVWIFWTEDYLSSWWTQGEILSTIYFTSPNDLPHKLKVYDPRTNTVHPMNPQYLPKLSEEQKARMTRYQTNSHPQMVGPEVLDRNQSVEQSPLSRIPAVRKLFLLDEPALSPDFWDYIVVPCKFEGKSLSQSESALDITQLYNEIENIDVDDFLKFYREGELIVSLEQLRKAAREMETLKCSRSSIPLMIKEQKPRYLWVIRIYEDEDERAGRVGKLKELPVYRLINRVE